jgi:hypothetical protein
MPEKQPVRNVARNAIVRRWPGSLRISREWRAASPLKSTSDLPQRRMGDDDPQWTRRAKVWPGIDGLNQNRLAGERPGDTDRSHHIGHPAQIPQDLEVGSERQMVPLVEAASCLQAEITEAFEAMV